ncbi:hypothetical protein [Actinoplanes palleronii]|uniref:hypothetical protein n=1 Tax=Actinoplanes palleronii TaxID=113570 RepID=UPI001943BAF7|nr:hypothetical protein [Actinoplanes palleronii]
MTQPGHRSPPRPALLAGVFLLVLSSTVTVWWTSRADAGRPEAARAGLLAAISALSGAEAIHYRSASADLTVDAQGNAAGVLTVGGKRVKLRGKTNARVPVDLVTPRTLADRLRVAARGATTAGPKTSIAGVDAWPIALPSGTVYISAAAPHHVLRLEQAGPRASLKTDPKTDPKTGGNTGANTGLSPLRAVPTAAPIVDLGGTGPIDIAEPTAAQLKEFQSLINR